MRRVDRADRGLRARWERRRSSAGWTPIAVANAWNANDRSASGFVGGPAWYRKDFHLPARARGARWRLRFDAVSYRARIWLNGRPIGSHAGAFIPFELPLPALRRVVNRLVLRVDNRRLPTNFPPTTFTCTDEPRRAWWNYGEIVREVYLRRLDRMTFDRVVVRPSVPCPTCRVFVRLTTTVRNVSVERKRVRVRANFGGLGINMGTVAVRPGGPHADAADRRLGAAPVDPDDAVPLSGRVLRGGRHAWPAEQGGALHRPHRPALGDRSRRPSRARRPAGQPPWRRDPRGPAPGKGPAWNDQDRLQALLQAKDAGATLVRSHYPFSPRFHELADRLGMLVWSEVPVYRMNTGYLFASTRRAAVDEVRRNVLDNENHPSVMAWSIGNELKDSVPGRVRSYIRAAARVAKGLDPSRPVGMAIEGHPLAACRTGYGPLNILGLNDHFGWYDGEVANPFGLSPYLDQMRACHPTKALMVTEFGAEANRNGRATEKAHSSSSRSSCASTSTSSGRSRG